MRTACEASNRLHPAAQVVIEAKRLIRTTVTTRQENVEVALPVEKEPWTLPKSVFAPRARRGPQQSDAKDYLDTPKVIESMFENDWSRMMAKVRRLGLPLLCDVVRSLCTSRTL